MPMWVCKWRFKIWRNILCFTLFYCFKSVITTRIVNVLDFSYPHRISRSFQIRLLTAHSPFSAYRILSDSRRERKNVSYSKASSSAETNKQSKILCGWGKSTLNSWLLLNSKTFFCNLRYQLYFYCINTSEKHIFQHYFCHWSLFLWS